ncbi:MAG: dienelactone hydrolase family protein [Acidobacteriaceae bacterium]|nr:dienelactone hydrolase family protein [Acidobacteriaceae bacterium]
MGIFNPNGVGHPCTNRTMLERAYDKNSPLATLDAMKAASKRYEPVTYDGAGHGFMRAGEQPGASEANKKAREEGWSRWKTLLQKGS